MELQQGQELAAVVIKALSPYCKKGKIEVVGSIRRKKPMVRDIDIVLIPSDLWGLHAELMKLGQVKMSGAKIVRRMIGIRQVDIYVADETTWATLLLIRTGSTENNVRLCSIAKKKGWHLAANGDGLFDETGKRIAGETEESIFKTLGLKYLTPEQR